MQIASPKQEKRGRATKASMFYNYYAGFSPQFVRDCIDLFHEGAPSVVFDPWIGSGTTAHQAARKGIRVYGCDLNPVMVIVAKARCSTVDSAASLRSAANKVIQASGHDGEPKADPLNIWFTDRTASYWRQIASAALRAAAPTSSFVELGAAISKCSNVGALLLVAIFRAARQSLSAFGTSNPTWIKTPSADEKVDLSSKEVAARFMQQVEALRDVVKRENKDIAEDVASDIVVADSRMMPLDSGAVDLVIASPPYCTRIDYAVATAPELAILGFSRESSFRALRESLTGSTLTRADDLPHRVTTFPGKCGELLAAIEAHPSKASGTYYVQQFRQYFADMTVSLRELSRVIRGGGEAYLVIQDSMYKDIHIDLAEIIEQLAVGSDFKLGRRWDFPSPRTFRAINTKARRNKKSWTPTESVVLLRK